MCAWPTWPLPPWQVTERHIYLILEYCAGGDLTHLLRRNGPLTEDRAQFFLVQLGALVPPSGGGSTGRT